MKDVKQNAQGTIKLEDLPEEEPVIIIEDTVSEDVETNAPVEEQEHKHHKKGIVKRVTGWCKRHKKAIIVTSVVAGATIGGIAYYRHYKRNLRRHQKALEALAEGAIDTTANANPALPTNASKAIADLPMAEYASDALDYDGTWLADKMPDLTTIDRTGKTLLQNLPNLGDADYTHLTRKIVNSNKEEITKAVLESLDNVIDNVDIDTIKSVSLLYDIS